MRGGRRRHAACLRRRTWSSTLRSRADDDRAAPCSAGGYVKRIVFLGVLTLCQVVPMYAIYTFGPEIMTAFGLGEGHEAILGESVVSLFFLDRFHPGHVLAELHGPPSAAISLACAHGVRALSSWACSQMHRCSW